ncbi:MAG TPA: RNA polymerase sigma factor [Thermoleophilaceae bacterium]|nr:RNA polymerase sigma factor [Thermoleophilaceae bacterium]
MGRRDERDDAALLAAVAREPEAFATFYDRYADSVFAFLLTRTRRRDLAADLTAETFAAALASAARYRGTAPTAAPWLFGIARNKMLDSFRRRRVEDAARRRLGMEPLVLSDDDLAELEARLDLAQHEEWLREALASLPDEQRAALLARVVDEREYGEIAAEVACSPAVIRQRVSRGLATLRSRFSEEP